MGHCGCANIYGVDKVFWVEKDVSLLMVSIYSGCDYCKTPIGIDLIVIGVDEAKKWGIDLGSEIQELEPDEFGFSRHVVNIFNPHDLNEIDFVEEEIPTMEHYDNINDWLHDNGQRMIETAIWSFGQGED